MDAALEVFARLGYRGASIDEIAGAANVSKALIYEHFESKRALHAALLERAVRELILRLRESAAAVAPGEARLRTGVDAFLAFAGRRRGTFRMLFRDAAEPEVAEPLRRVQRQFAVEVAGLLAAEPLNPDSGEKSDEQAIEMIAQLLTGAVQSLALWWDEHRDVPRDLLVDQVMDFAWIGFERLRAADG